MPRPLRQGLLGLGVVLLQYLVLSRFSLWGVTPDAVLLFVVINGLRGGRTVGALSGFAAGLLMDVLVNPVMLGLNAMLKTLLGFAVGFFQVGPREPLRLDPFLAFLGAFVMAAAHNGLLVIILALEQSTRNAFMIFGLWLGGALYTAVLAFILSFFRRPT